MTAFNTLRDTINRFLPKSGFGRSVALLTGGTALGQGLVVITSPILTRLYSPEDLGAAFVFLSIMTTLVVVMSLRYDYALLLPKDDETAANLFALSLLLIPLLGGGLLLVILFAPDAIASLLNVPELRHYLWLLPLALMGGGLYQVFTQWGVRRKEFRQIAETKVSQNVGQVVTQVGLGFLWATPLGLILGYIVGQIGGVGKLARSAWEHDHALLQKASWSGMRAVLGRYWRFPAFSMPSGIINSLGLRLAPLLLTIFYSTQITGWFALANRLTALPVALLTANLNQVFYAEATRLMHEEDMGKLRQLYIKWLGRLVIVSVPIGLGLAVFGAWGVEFIFGSNWREVGVYLQYMCIMLMGQLVGSSLLLLSVFELTHWQLAWDIGRLMAVGGCFLIANQAGWSARESIAAYSITMTGAYIVLVFLNLVSFRTKTRQLDAERLRSNG